MENKGEIIIYQSNDEVKTLSPVEQAYLDTIKKTEKKIGKSKKRK